MKLNVGMYIESTDGSVGEVADVVIDPVKRQVTHLVVQPHRHHERARLVPIGAISSCDDKIVLSWSSAQVDDAPVVEQTDFVHVGAGPQLQGRWGVGVSTVLAWPYYPYGGIVAGHGFSGYPYGYGIGVGSPSGSVVKMTYDRVPEDTVEVRRASKVISSDGHVIGHVDGFIIDPSEAITHLVLGPRAPVGASRRDDPGHRCGQRRNGCRTPQRHSRRGRRLPVCAVPPPQIGGLTPTRRPSESDDGTAGSAGRRQDVRLGFRRRHDGRECIQRERLVGVHLEDRAATWRVAILLAGRTVPAKTSAAGSNRSVLPT